MRPQALIIPLPCPPRQGSFFVLCGGKGVWRGIFCSVFFCFKFAKTKCKHSTMMQNSNFNFASLLQTIAQIQEAMQAHAAHAVNLALTVRNWLIGRYIVEYEQHGNDRAQYGDRLLKNIAGQLHTRGLGERRLYEFRQLYIAYPYLEKEIIKHISQSAENNILRSITAKSALPSTEEEKLRSATAISEANQAESWQTPADKSCSISTVGNSTAYCSISNRKTT